MSHPTTKTKALGWRKPTIIRSRCLVYVQAIGEAITLK